MYSNPKYLPKSNKTDLPRICSVLCPENPLKVGEEFTVEKDPDTFYINADGNIIISSTSCGMGNEALLEAIINGELKIIRRPQFSEDEKALMRLFVANGRPIFKPDKNGKCIVAWDKDEIRGNGLPKGLLSQITDRFDAAAYLESEGEK